MSTLKRINLTRIVPLLIMGLSVLCCLRLAERSALYRLTAKAYVNAFDDVQTFRIIDSQWESSDPAPYEYKAFAFTGDGKASYTAVGCSFTSAYRGDIPLEYTLEIFDYYNNRIYICPIYAEMGERVDFGLPKVNATTDITYRVHLYVRRKDGGNMYKSDMYASSFTMYYVREEEVPDNTLPADWFSTTTAYIDNPLSTMTTVIPSEYDPAAQDVSPYLVIPEKITAGISGLIYCIGRLFQLKYVTFLCCFVLIVGLVAWLIH